MSVKDGVATLFAMARNEPGWEERYDLSAAAVFASFWAVPLALPGGLLIGEVARQAAAQTPGLEEAASTPALPFAIIQLFSLLASWGFGLLVVTRIAARTGAGWRVTPVIIGYNWAFFVVHLVAGLNAALAVGLGLMPLVSMAALAAIILNVWLLMGVAKQGFAVDTGPAVGIVMMVYLAKILGSLLTSTLGGLVLGTGAA